MNRENCKERGSFLQLLFLPIPKPGFMTDLENKVLNQAALRQQMKTGSAVRGKILKKKTGLLSKLRSETFELKGAHL